MGFLGDLFKPKAQSQEDAQRSQMMMERLKARRGPETAKWLSMMEDAGRLPPPEGPPPTIEDVDEREVIDDTPYVPPMEAQYTDVADDGPKPDLSAPEEQNQTVAWVEKLFAEFQRRADEYNSATTEGQLKLIVNPPEFTFEKPNFEEAYNAKERVSIFKGHIVAQHWAMLIQGYEKRIEVYVISGDDILNFTLNDIRNLGVSPFMTIEASEDNNSLAWNIAGTIISQQTLPLLAKELLGDLIRISAGTMSEEELFADFQTGLKLGETVAHGYTPSQNQATP